MLLFSQNVFFSDLFSHAADVFCVQRQSFLRMNEAQDKRMTERKKTRTRPEKVMRKYFSEEYVCLVVL